MAEIKKMETLNPLAVTQREVAGASTYGKYEYQYHWALGRVLDEHSSSTDYGKRPLNPTFSNSLIPR